MRVADGKVMWKLTGKAYNGHSITVAGDYMVINEVGETKKYKSAQLGAYKLTPEEAQHLGRCPGVTQQQRDFTTHHLQRPGVCPTSRRQTAA